MVGKSLSCDEQTNNCTRLEYARGCVEITTALPLINRYDIVSLFFNEPITVEVEYEWKPPRCNQCKLQSVWSFLPYSVGAPSPSRRT